MKIYMYEHVHIFGIIHATMFVQQILTTSSPPSPFNTYAIYQVFVSSHPRRRRSACPTAACVTWPTTWQSWTPTTCGTATNPSAVVLATRSVRQTGSPPAAPSPGSSRTQVLTQSNVHTNAGTDTVWCTQDSRYWHRLMFTRTQVLTQSDVHKKAGTDTV